MPIDADLFRSVLGRFATGITIVTVRDDEGRDHGMTVSAFSSLSLEPPLVLVCIGNDATMSSPMQSAESFGVNILSASQEALSRRFAGPIDDRFADVSLTRGSLGNVILDHVLASLECRVIARHPAGDHVIVVGEVDSGVRALVARCFTIAAVTLSSSAEMGLTPARQRGHEILDDPATDPQLAVRSLKDVALANLLFGGRRAILRELRTVLGNATSGSPLRLLDIGTGLGDIPAAATRDAQRRERTLDTIGVELAPSIAVAARSACTFVVVADAMHLPFADRSVDVVTCSQVLHHFEGGSAERLLRECTRVARRAVVVGDLRRSWFAVAGLWLTSFGLGFHPVSRHDGVVSILRGFTRAELAALVERATGRRAIVRHALGWRLTATWSPASSAS